MADAAPQVVHTVGEAARGPNSYKTLSECVAAASAGDMVMVLPGVYEGGFKLWECAVDLAGFLAELPDAELGPAHRVLELGCGHGLPGLVALRRGAQVDFVEYNVEVLQQLTIPNAVAAEADQQAADALGDLERVLGALAGRARFFSGAWCVRTFINFSRR